MARVHNPLASLRAWGRVAPRLAARRAPGGPLLQAVTPPRDAKTSSQLAWRTMYQLAVGLWQQLTGAEKASWETAARPHRMTGYNYFLSQALRPNPGVYLPLAGGTMSGEIAMSSNKVSGLPAPTADGDATRKKYVDDAIAGVSGIPAGVICMWHGTLATIPDGWHLCDGTEGTPDLRSKFVQGAAPSADPGATGGSNTHDHDQHGQQAHAGTAVANHSSKNTGLASASLELEAGSGAMAATYNHVHSVGSYTHSVTQPNNHPALSHSTASNVPVYYAVAFIMKL